MENEIFPKSLYHIRILNPHQLFSLLPNSLIRLISPVPNASLAFIKTRSHYLRYSFNKSFFLMSYLLVFLFRRLSLLSGGEHKLEKIGSNYETEPIGSVNSVIGLGQL